MKKLLILMNLILLNACQAEPHFALKSDNANTLPEITRLADEDFDTPVERTSLVKDGHCWFGKQQIEYHFFPMKLCSVPKALHLTAEANHIQVLSDNVPVIFENKVLFLGDPDSETYPHGVLGDDVEAKTLYTLDTATLKHAAKPFRLPENFVFENNTVTLWGDKVVAVVSGGGAGAKVVVLRLNQENWQIIAESTPLPKNRWQSPFVFANELYAVQMPHLHGRLVKYVLQNNQLIEQEISEGLSNHAIDSRDTQIAAVLPDYALIPDMGFRHIVALDRSGSLNKLSPKLPTKVVRSAVQNGTVYFLLADGSVWAWSQPERSSKI